MHRPLFCLGATAITALSAAVALAQPVIIKVQAIHPKGIGKDLGTVTAEDGRFGLLLTPKLTGLTPGLHGFHVHENASCSHGTKDGHHLAGHSAGGHLDPANTGRHEGPYRQGHLGDLPALWVGADGTASLPVLAPRLKASDLRGRALMIHAGADNYSDEPEKLGGGGSRAACGVAN